ncbi:hypothetical protein LPJ53_005585 [Coemansia erecta]|uniref:Uncharacterized protein n=1 Tax=Coemansia erecta TaxID=147472 RepID=A0A9W7XWC4_9FUNG|nr:hypothetical protein LPJ53_005585 [Coemansia erecta]
MRSASVIVSATALIALQLFGSGILVSAKCSFDEISVDTNPGFQITVNDDYKLVEDTSANVKYGLYCDTQPSNVDGVDKWFKVPVSAAGIRIPIASGFVEALGLRSAVTAIESPGNLTNICFDTSKIKSLDEPNGSEVSDVDVIFSANASSDGNQSVRLPSDDTLLPLQKAEWLKFFAAFFNEENSAASLFSLISDSYNCHRGNMRNLKTPPHAYWVQYSDDSGQKTYNIITSAYQKELLAGAGATNDTSKALDDPTDVTSFQNAVKDASYVFDQTDLQDYGQRITEWYSDFGYTDPRNTDVNFLLQRQIWRTEQYVSKSGISNFPEFAYVRPDLVLQDVISVVVPTYNTEYQRRWMSWFGSTNEDSDTIDQGNYDCESSWMSVVDQCDVRSDFDGTAPSSSDGNDDDNDGNDKEGDNDSGSSSSGHGRTGKIVGGVIAGVVFIALAFVALHYYNRHRRQARIRALSQNGYSGHEHIGLSTRYSE